MNRHDRGFHFRYSDFPPKCTPTKMIVFLFIFPTKMIGAKWSAKMIARKHFQVSHQNDRSFWFVKSKWSGVQREPTSHQNDRTENFSHQNDRLTVTRHTLIIITTHHHRPCTRRLAGYVANEPNILWCRYSAFSVRTRAQFWDETHYSSFTLAGRPSFEKPTVPDFPDIEFVQSEGQWASIFSREGTVSVLGLSSVAWERSDRSETGEQANVC